MQKLSGFRSLEDSVSMLLKPAFNGIKKDFVIVNNLIKNWQEIVGEKYSKLCSPKSVRFDKLNKNVKLTVIAYNSAIAFFLENNSEIIIERIASLYGFKSISKIIIKQETRKIDYQKARKVKLSVEQENEIERIVYKIENEELAKTLQKLGEEILEKVK